MNALTSQVILDNLKCDHGLPVQCAGPDLRPQLQLADMLLRIPDHGPPDSPPLDQ